MSRIAVVACAFAGPRIFRLGAVEGAIFGAVVGAAAGLLLNMLDNIRKEKCDDE